MTDKKLSINTENILPIIKKWLYADREVFLRELVANAQDAISKRKIAFHQDVLDVIKIHIDKENKTLSISDSGIGMTEEEIERYIAQIAFSGAEDFAEQYQNGKEAIIGHFGLGFFSAYMVAKTVEIHSLSFKEGATGAYWKCDGGVDYTLESKDKEEKGTTITLHIEDDALEFLEEERILSLLSTYCQFFPAQIFVNDKAFETKTPLWLKTPQSCTKEDYLNFYKTLYPFESEPLFWVHLNIDYPYNVKGILYFPKVDKSYDFQKSHIRLFSNRVFVSENIKDLLPDYLTVLKGCLDSTDIPLNVSRSYLQMDKNVRSLSSHISKKVTGVLQDQFNQDRTAFEKNFADIEMVIKLGLLQDEKLFEKVENFFLLKTLDGSFKTLEEAKGLLEKPTLYYVQDQHQSKNLIDVFKEKNISLYLLNCPLDSALLNLLETKKEIKFERIDGKLPDELCDIATFDVEKIKPYFEDLEVSIKKFPSKKIPGCFVIDENMRRFKEYMQLSRQGSFSNFPEKHPLVLNESSPLVEKLFSIQDPVQAKTYACWIKDLIRLSQGLLEQKEIATFIENASAIVETQALVDG